MKTHVLSAIAAAGLLLHAQVAPDDDSWPRSYTVDGAEVILYEPHIEKWQGSSLDARFAAGIKLKGANEAAYGSFAAHADALANTETRTVTLFNFTAADVKFPEASDKLAEFTRIINALAPEKPVKVPLDILLGGVPSEDVITKTTVTTPTQTKAPKVLVRFDNTVLVAFDGKPVFRGIPGTGLEAAVNTPATILRPENGGPLYLLTNEGLWLQAAGWGGPWSAATSLPSGIDRIPPDHPVAQAVKNVWPPPGAVVSVPDVVTSESPTELIQINGKPKYDRIGELPLVRVSNTDSPLFYHFDQAVFYVLISGRWFVAPELLGPWTYVPHNELPDDFAQIPADDPSADVRASIAGTREAEEAAKEAQIPSYARVDVRKPPQVRVEYDGEPVFEDVPGTGLAYAINTTSAVVCVGDRYYCCQDGLWFAADAAFGAPWRWVTILPQEIYSMPPSCPLYHTRFCDVDSFDDDWVTYRCTPGYWGTYLDPFSNVCVYGTGWWYPAYVSRNYYCGHSWTYGLGCRYVPRCGFVRECDRVAHTSWFRHTGRGSALCRADSASWGGRFERDHWHGSSGHTTAFSSWSSQVVTHSDEVVKGFHHREWAKDQVAHGSDPKLKVESRGHASALSLAPFDKDVRAGHQGEVYRHGAEGWQRRDSGQWKQADQNHPVDARVVESHKSRELTHEKKQVATSNAQGFTRENRAGQVVGPQTFNPDKGRAILESSHREFEIRSARPAHTEEKNAFVASGQGYRVERNTRRLDEPPAHQEQHTEKKEVPQFHVEQQPPARIHREPVPEPRRIEHYEVPHIERRDSQPQMQQHHEEARRIEHHEAPPQMPRQVQPQVQQHHEEPRRIEQPQPRQDHGSGSHDSRSHRGDDKKDDKKR